MTLKQFSLSLAIFASLLYGTVLHYLPIGERDVQHDIGTLWQESNVWGDAGMYLAQVDDFALSQAPYRYRILPTLAVRAIDSAWGVPPIVGYVLLNCLCFLIVGVGFTAYLMRWFDFPTSLIGGILTVTTVPMQSMMLLPMGEPASYVAALCVFWAMQTRDSIVFSIVASLAVLTKEVFIVTVPIYLVLEMYGAGDTYRLLYARASGIWRQRP